MIKACVIFGASFSDNGTNMILGVILVLIGIFLALSAWKKNRYYFYFQSLFKHELIVQKTRLILIFVSIISIIVGYFLLIGVISYHNPFIEK
jgi:uncharacterized membrane protein YidH (DUF202 family)